MGEFETKVKTVEKLISQMGIKTIRRKGEVIFQQNHFCKPNKKVIKETIDNLLMLNLD
jgi:hypothetical protein